MQLVSKLVSFEKYYYYSFTEIYLVLADKANFK